jgi:hypothetical protein
MSNPGRLVGRESPSIRLTAFGFKDTGKARTSFHDSSHLIKLFWWRCERVSKRGTSPTVRKGSHAQFDEPSLTVGLMPRVSAIHLPHYLGLLP